MCAAPVTTSLPSTPRAPPCISLCIDKCRHDLHLSCNLQFELLRPLLTLLHSVDGLDVFGYRCSNALEVASTPRNIAPVYKLIFP